MAANAPAYIASGNINPCRFVKADATKDFHVLQCTGTSDKPVGISQVGTHQPPGVTGSDGFAAHSGETLEVFGPGDQCLLEAGGTIAAGDHLGPDTSGRGVTATVDPTCAMALEAATGAGVFIRVVFYTPVP